MPKYIIEREMPGAGKMSPQDVKEIAVKSCAVLRELGPKIQWQESYVSEDKVYCVYIAQDEKLIREHAKLTGFPTDRISAVTATIDPTIAE